MEFNASPLCNHLFFRIAERTQKRFVSAGIECSDADECIRLGDVCGLREAGSCDGHDGSRRTTGWAEASDLRDHAELGVAGQRSARGSHSHTASRRTAVHGRLDFAARYDGECRRGAIKADAARARYR